MRIVSNILFFLFAIETRSEENVTVDSNGVCKGSCTTDASGNKECTFTAILNLYASEWGYYSFKECGEETNPVLGLEVGATYTFDQSDITNWYHPLGFAYYADGAHDDVDELEPVISPPGSGSKCEENVTCPAPMYMLNDEYLGSYSNNDLIKDVTMDDENFGLDDYEPKFFLPIADWKDQGKFSVKLKIDESAIPIEDIFYFCHIHQYMTGRIKILNKDLTYINTPDNPTIPYQYDTVSDYDKSCGTYNINAYQLPHPMCPDKFVCDVPTDVDQSSKDLSSFSNCVESMDCAMVVGMTNLVSAESEVALFIHQMIPHHQNAVNMAKALFKTGKVKCDDITEESDDCTLLGISLSIINEQNHQIQMMRGILEGMGYPEEDQCVLDSNDINSGAATKIEKRMIALILPLLCLIGLVSF